MNHARLNMGPLRTMDVVALAIGLGMTAMVYVLGIHPVIEQRHHLQEQQETLAREQDRAETLSRTAQQLRSHLQATNRAVDRNPLRLASLRALNERLSQMTELGMESGLRIEGIQPGGRLPGDHYYTVPIKLVGNGEFSASTRFLHQLHESFPDVAIASLSLAGRPDRAAADQTPSFDLTLLWYAAPPVRSDEEQG